VSELGGRERWPLCGTRGDATNCDGHRRRRRRRRRRRHRRSFVVVVVVVVAPCVSS